MFRLRTILLMWVARIDVAPLELRVSQAPASPAQDRLGMSGPGDRIRFFTSIGA